MRAFLKMAPARAFLDVVISWLNGMKAIAVSRACASHCGNMTIAMLQSRYLLVKWGVSPLAMPRSSSSISRKVTSAHGQGDLRITVRASPSSASPRASHSSSTSQHLVFPDELAGSSDRVEPSISFGGPVDDRMLIAALKGEIDSGDDYSILHAPSEKEHTLREALLLLGHWRGGLQ